MSQENVEIVRVTIDLFNAGQIDQALERVSDEFEMDWSNSLGPLKGIYRGRQRVLELWDSFLDAWETVRWEPQEIIDVDGTHVLVINHLQMRGRESGVEVDATGAHLWTITAGKGRRIKLFQTKDEALEAAGLSK